MSVSSVLRCAGCGERVPPDEPEPWRCPRAGDGGEHVLRVDLAVGDAAWPASDAPQPFLAWSKLLHARRAPVGRAGPPRHEAWEDAVVALDAGIAHTVGHGLERAPLVEARALRDDLGVARVRVLDATRQPGGTHKVRHLFGVAAWLDLAGVDRARPLAIASCGNAALAAAIVARAQGRDLEVHVPTGAHEPVLRELRELGAHVVTCERLPGERGDPCLRAFRAAVERGAVPFSVQGPENGLAVEGGRTLAWDLVGALRADAAPLPGGPGAPAPGPDVVLVQVGGGALASAFFQGLEVAVRVGALERLPRVLLVQTAAVHPLERAWRRVAADVARPAGGAAELRAPELARAADAHYEREVLDALGRAAAARDETMRPWESTPTSVADAMLDDETYDWLEACRAMLTTGGWPVLADELTLVEARELAVAATGIEVSHTGSAGLAGALLAARAGDLRPDADVVVLFTG